MPPPQNSKQEQTLTRRDSLEVYTVGLALQEKLKKVSALFADLSSHEHFEIIDWRRIDERLTSELARLTASHFGRETSYRAANKLLNKDAGSSLKEFARKHLHQEVRKGAVKRSRICDICGEFGFIEAHHEDYNKPLSVKWLCRKCHTNIHKERNDSQERAGKRW